MEKAALLLTFFALLMPAFSMQGYADSFSEFPFRQEINIHASDDMAYQPVDVTVHFSRSCWAEDETHNSVRIVYDDGSEKKEIECQVYNLHHTGSSYIDSCNIVFLLHGSGKYYVYYSDRKVDEPDYPDHVSVSDDFYYYEPIPGYRISLDYYRIEQDGCTIYGIGQQGNFFGIDMSQKVIKQLDGKRDFRIFNWGQLASFAMFWYGGRDEGTDEKLISKEIIADGNLMVRVGIKSMSSDGKMETDGIYTYYYCPSKEKRIVASIKHEAIEECRVEGMEEDDGLYTYLLTVKSRSSSIPDLNMGYIPPYLHINAEDGTVHEYNLDQNPENTDYNWLISAKDDIDLGSNPWFSIDDGEKGKAYAIIFKNNTVSRYEEGIQVAATEKQEINIPGLEVDGGGISGGRNSYEAGGIHNLVMPKGFTAKFTAEFFSSPDGGMPAVKKEAEIFQSLIPFRDGIPSVKNGWGGSGEYGGAGGGRYSLTVFPHFAPSLPFAPALSAVTGKMLPDVRVELWRNDSMVSSAACGRIPFTEEDGKIRFDWRNASLMKKALFRNVREGRYIVKVFRGMREKYVGAKSVYVDGDISVHIPCSFEGKAYVKISDQNGNGIDNVEVCLEKDGDIYSSNSTGESGDAALYAPMASKYVLKAYYKGFEIYSETLSFLSFVRRDAEIELNDMVVHITDSMGLPPGVKISPVLTSREMKREMSIYGEEISPGTYIFRELPSAPYTLQIRYKSFDVKKDVDFPEEKNVEVMFPAVYSLGIRALNSRGTEVKGIDIEVKRDGKDADITSIPPGRYEVLLMDNGKIVGEREVFITGDTELDMVTLKKPSFPGIASAAIISIALLFIFVRKMTPYEIFIISGVVLLMLSTLYPWWHMEGNGGVDVSTNVYLIPAKMVTMGTGNGFINGEVASLPSLFSTMILSVIAMLSLASISLLAFVVFRKKFVLLAAIAFSALPVITFSYGMSRITDATTGSFWGEGELGISLPGMSEMVIHCNWHPSVGYYIAILGAIISLASFIFAFRHSFPKVLKRL